MAPGDAETESSTSRSAPDAKKKPREPAALRLKTADIIVHHPPDSAPAEHHHHHPRHGEGAACHETQEKGLLGRPRQPARRHLQAQRSSPTPPPHRACAACSRPAVTKIKQTLIQRAKVYNRYQKTLSAEDPASDPNAQRARRLFDEAEAERARIAEERAARRRHAEALEQAGKPDIDASPKPAMHPARQSALEKMSEVDEAGAEHEHAGKRKRKPKTSSFRREETHAARAKAEREAAAKEAERKRLEREAKLKQREMRKKAMNARGRNGQRKLGKMSSVLLQQLETQMANERAP